jgi:hypothetical protein
MGFTGVPGSLQAMPARFVPAALQQGVSEPVVFLSVTVPNGRFSTTVPARSPVYTVPKPEP